jgi:hypothetical protein
MVSQE